MSLEDFRKAVTILNPQDASTWRTRYIEAFVDTTKEYYKKHVERLKRYSDGLFYEGYLWNCIKSNWLAVSFEDFCMRLRSHKQPVFVMWDLHSRDKIPVEDYWKFDRENVLAVSPDVLAANLEYLPEDIYVYDPTLSWSLSATHEHTDTNPRLCVSVGPPH